VTGRNISKQIKTNVTIHATIVLILIVVFDGTTIPYFIAASFAVVDLQRVYMSQYFSVGLYVFMGLDSPALCSENFVVKAHQ
jgi:hypothetical protein